MQLYHSPSSRSVRVRWMLEEIGAPYELVRLDLSKGEQKTASYRKIHPHGAVPALLDGTLVLIESAAICAHLADKFPEKQLAPALGSASRAKYHQWMFYAVATLEPPVVQIFLHSISLPEAQRSASLVEEGRKRFEEIANVLSKELQGKSYILGEQFSAADIMIGSTLGWAKMMGVLGDQPVLDGYVQRLLERPALQRAQAD